jgi:hypothetical protein
MVNHYITRNSYIINCDTVFCDIKKIIFAVPKNAQSIKENYLMPILC